MKNFALTRPETVKSQLYVELMAYANTKLDLFNLILDSVKRRTFNIEVTADLITYVYMVQPLFHRRFAMSYLEKLV